MNKNFLILTFAALLSFGAPNLVLAYGTGVYSVPISPEQQANIDQAMSLTNEAQADLDAGDTTRALARAKESLALNSNDIGCPDTIVAKCLAIEGKTSDALNAFYNIAYRENDSGPEDILPYALLLLKNGQWALALRTYYIALPHVGSLLMNGHDLLVNVSQYDYNDPQPNSLELDIHIAMGFTQIDDFGRSGKISRERSLAEYKEALALAPQYPLANLAYASGLYQLNRRAEARAAFLKASNTYSGPYKAAADKELLFIYP